MDIEKIIKKANMMIKNNEELNDFELRYVLMDENDKKNPIVITYDYDTLYNLDVLNDTFYSIGDWTYNIDNDIFEELEKGKKIGYMDLGTHYNIWSYVDDMYDDIDHIDGMNRYIEYCIDNNIIKEKLEEKLDLDVPDIMKYYKKNQELER